MKRTSMAVVVVLVALVVASGVVYAPKRIGTEGDDTIKRSRTFPK
jgi:hypothetical protein